MAVENLPYQIDHVPSGWRWKLCFAAAVALAVTGCKSTDKTRLSLFGARAKPVVTGSIPNTSPSLSRTRKLAARWRARPGHAGIGLAYAKHLRSLGSHAQARAILRKTVQRNPKNRDVLIAYANELARAGELKAAFRLLQRAHRHGAPDWRVYSAQGTVYDRMGAHNQARTAYGYALKLAPQNPAIHNNLGMSLALSGQLKQAETTLRAGLALPGAAPRVRQNLALVVGLQGRFAEAEKIAASDLPPHMVQANIAYLRQMLSQPNRWQALKKLNKS